MTARQIAGSDLAGLSVTPPYAGAGVLSSVLVFNSPSPITAVTHTFGYGTTTQELGQLSISSSSINNVLAIEQKNLVGFATLTFRGKDNYYSDNTTVFEHGTVGWVPGYNTGTAVQGAFIVEASRLTGSALFPPPAFYLFQTGGVDPTGGTTKTCGITNASTAITCASNLGANGTLITGTGIPAGTTVVSGGGTTSGVMSNAATATNASASLNFSTPVNLQYQVMECSPTGNINFHGWDVSTILGINRNLNRVGINTTTPAYPLDVNGAAQLNGALNFSGGGSVTGGGGLPLSLVAGNHVVQNTDNVNGIASFKVANASAGASAQAMLSLATGTANSSLGVAVLDQGGTPIVLWNVGSAVGNTLIRAGTGPFFFQSSGGTTDVTLTPGTSLTAVSPITACVGTAIPAGGTAGSGLKFSSTANFGVFFGSGVPTLSAAKGSLYLRSDGTTTNDRAFINTNGSTTWTALTTAA